MDSNAKNLLTKYAERVLFWNQKINLTGAKNSHDFFEEHILDCWAAQQSLPLHQNLNQNWIDVGSGAGLPGIMWAIARPQDQFILIESLQKRASFLQHVVAELKLGHVQVKNQRFEAFDSSFSPAEKTPTQNLWNCVSRGTASPKTLWHLASHARLDWANWYVFSSQRTHEEFIELAQHQDQIDVSFCSYIYRHSKNEDSSEDFSKKVLTKLTRKVSENRVNQHSNQQK